MTKKRRMPVNVLQGPVPARARDPVLEGIVGGGEGSCPAEFPSAKGDVRAQGLVPSRFAGDASSVPSRQRRERVRDWLEARRLRQAEGAVRVRAFASLLVGLVPWLPAALAVLVGIHLASLRALAGVYEVPWEKNAVRGGVASLVGTVAALAVARLAASVLQVLPVPGWIVGALCLGCSSAASTFVVGRVFIKHFEAGETLLSLDPTATKIYFRQTPESGVDEEGSQGE